MEQRNSDIDLQSAAAEIRKIYHADPTASAAAIEAYLEERLKTAPPETAAVFPKRVQFAICGEEEALLAIPPPEPDWLSQKTQLMMVPDPALNKPPP